MKISIARVVIGSTICFLFARNLKLLQCCLVPSTIEKSAFDTAADALFVEAFKHDEYTPQVPKRRSFHLSNWTRGNGGLDDKDRELLSKIYREAESVFEFGLGESTYIAAEVGVPRYSGIDSDPMWVAIARNRSLSHFRFYFADIGETLVWGYPKQQLAKNKLNYQAVPLLSEPMAFDVYMVDGRWRIPLVAFSFLHASARGGQHAHTKVLLHDCGVSDTSPVIEDLDFGRMYHKLNDIVELTEHSHSRLCVLHRKEKVTNDDILKFWHETCNLVAR